MLFFHAVFFHSHTEPKFKCQLCCKTRPDFSGKLGCPALLRLQIHTLKIRTHTSVLGVTANSVPLCPGRVRALCEQRSSNICAWSADLLHGLFLVWDRASINIAGLSSVEVYLRNEGPTFQPGACHLNISSQLSWGLSKRGKISTFVISVCDLNFFFSSLFLPVTVSLLVFRFPVTSYISALISPNQERPRIITCILAETPSSAVHSLGSWANSFFFFFCELTFLENVLPKSEALVLSGILSEKICTSPVEDLGDYEFAATFKLKICPFFLMATMVTW